MKFNDFTAYILVMWITSIDYVSGLKVKLERLLWPKVQSVLLQVARWSLEVVGSRDVAMICAVN